MEKSNIDASIKEAVIAEVKKLTGYKPEDPNQLCQCQLFGGSFSVKYVHDTLLRIADGDLVIFFTPKALPDDIIWRKAAEMLKIAVEVQEPRRTEVFSHLWVHAQQYLGWHCLDKKVDPKDEGIGYVKFWGSVKRIYGEGVPSNEQSNWIEAKAESEKGCTRREYLDLIVDEILVQADAPKKVAPEYIPPTPPVNPIEQALAEIAELKTRVTELEKPKEIQALRDRLTEIERDSKTLANLAYNRVSAFIGQGITPSQQDFEHWWAEFRKENGYATEQPTEPEYSPTPDQIYTLWLLVKDGDKSFQGALPYKIAPHMFQPKLFQVEVRDAFEFTLSPTKFYPLVNSKGERPTFDQCRQAVVGTLFTALQTLFNDQAK